MCPGPRAPPENLYKYIVVVELTPRLSRPSRCKVAGMGLESVQAGEYQLNNSETSAGPYNDTRILEVYTV